jgi:3',5'-cyclic-AMP phosphodiesterase
MKKLCSIFCVISLAVSCDSFEYSPNQIFDKNTPRNLNALNLERLHSKASDDTVTIAFVGDSQRFYDEVDDFVKKVNTYPSVDFIVLDGDITDFGLLNEYEWINDSFSKLIHPYIGVIGNHDVISEGEEVFTRMFGPLNFSFVYDSIKFVAHNTNSREYVSKLVPDIQWLKNEFEKEESVPVKYIIGISHVPPTNEDFNPELVAPYSQLMASTPGFLVSLHAHVHEHEDGYPFNDGVRYITSFAFNQRSFVMFKIVNGSISKEIISY